MRFILPTLFPLLFVCAATPAQDAVRAAVDGELPSLIELYQQLHANPELSLEEVKTSARMAAEIKARGFEVTTEVGGHGVVGLMRNGAGPTVLVRTDLDALPIEEATGLAYASKVRGKNAAGQECGIMHACGHDMHMAVWVGVARVLDKLKDHWQGTVVMVGQPAEERTAGALAMLKDGLFERWPAPDYALALHVDPNLEAGKVGWTAGPALANVDAVDVVIRGVGGHGAYPHNAKDPVVLACQMVLAFQTIVSREIRPLDPAVVTVGSIHGGTKHNIIPDEVKLQLTVRCYSDAVREKILAAIKRIAEGEARAAGMPEDRLPIVTVDEMEHTPAMINDPELTKRVAAALRQGLGQDVVIERPAEMGAEDFAHFGRFRAGTKACMFRLGSVSADKMAASKQSGAMPLSSVHSARYAPDPAPTITTGVRGMAAAVMDLLPRK